MHRDFKELLSAFNDGRVKYLIVGGYAVSFHAQPRATKDLDILIGADPENSEAVYIALAKFGAPIEGLSAQDFAQPDNFFRMGTPPVMVDIMPKISGVEFEQAWQRRVDVQISDDLTVPFISLQDLMAAKISAGRSQDLIDVDALRQNIEHQEGKQDHLISSISSARDELENTKEKRRENWLKLRDQQKAAELTPEDRKTKKREDWLKLRQRTVTDKSQDARNSSALGAGDTEFKDSQRIPNKDIDDDLTQ
jgi:hypothetical protein